MFYISSYIPLYIIYIMYLSIYNIYIHLFLLAIYLFLSRWRLEFDFQVQSYQSHSLSISYCSPFPLLLSLPPYPSFSRISSLMSRLPAQTTAEDSIKSLTQQFLLPAASSPEATEVNLPLPLLSLFPLPLSLPLSLPFHFSSRFNYFTRLS